jgi:hypothetical protein
LAAWTANATRLGYVTRKNLNSPAPPPGWCECGRGPLRVGVGLDLSESALRWLRSFTVSLSEEQARPGRAAAGGPG